MKSGAVDNQRLFSNALKPYLKVVFAFSSVFWLDKKEVLGRELFQAASPKLPFQLLMKPMQLAVPSTAVEGSIDVDIVGNVSIWLCRTRALSSRVRLRKSAEERENPKPHLMTGPAYLAFY